MVTKIIAIGDIHIRNFKRMEEYQGQMMKFFDEARSIVRKNGVENTRIVVTGDVFHNKTTVSPEANMMVPWFLRKLDEICKTYVIAGNHDMIVSNTSRLDALTPVFAMCNFKQVVYLDKELAYESGCLTDDNLLLCLYSSFDAFRRPEIEQAMLNMKGSGDGAAASLFNDVSCIGLIHADIKGSKSDAGYCSATGLEPSYFDGLDCCLCGHIHKRQELSYNGTKILYTGSLIQQDHGENITGHGYLVWNVEEGTYEIRDIENPDYGFYTFAIESAKDIEEDTEQIINL